MLVTVWIIGAAVVAMVSGMFTMVKASDVQRRTAVAETQLRRLVEVVRAAPYVPCYGSMSFPRKVTTYTDAYTGGGNTIVVNGDTISVDTTQDIEHWGGSLTSDGSPNLQNLWHGCPAGGDQGIQVFSLGVTVLGAPDVATHTQFVVKRDNR